jgi:hypothetical protein
MALAHSDARWRQELDWRVASDEAAAVSDALNGHGGRAKLPAPHDCDPLHV